MTWLNTAELSFCRKMPFELSPTSIKLYRDFWQSLFKLIKSVLTLYIYQISITSMMRFAVVSQLSWSLIFMWVLTIFSDLRTQFLLSIHKRLSIDLFFGVILLHLTWSIKIGLVFFHILFLSVLSSMRRSCWRFASRFKAGTDPSAILVGILPHILLPFLRSSSFGDRFIPSSSIAIFKIDKLLPSDKTSPRSIVSPLPLVQYNPIIRLVRIHDAILL